MTNISFSAAGLVRKRWRITGQVQGVGFRPFVYKLGRDHGLVGWVLNTGEGVTLEAQGRPADLAAFAQDLRQRAPALARIRHIDESELPLVPGERGFTILPSLRRAGPALGDVAVDTAVCEACLHEIRTDGDRRHGYGLINCTNCGPRYTILQRLPYDRANTTMTGFTMCETCRQQYQDPSDRRFHAEPIACEGCGPQVSLVEANGTPTEGDPILGAVGRILEGQIVAIKGLGGFHLAVRADDPAAVARLRQLKNRDAKPFALMCANVEEAKRVAMLSERGLALLCSSARPIVLARKRPWNEVAPGVAAGTHRLGIMLPYTPLQHLLFDRAAAIEPGSLERGVGTWVMTSANASDEPLVISNEEAVARLGGLCDAILWHNRPIERAVDDSIFVDMGEEAPIPIRRARGYVPMGIDLPVSNGQMGLCVGGELKATIAVVRGDREGREMQAILSQHLGDLPHPLAWQHFQKAVADLQQLMEVEPAWVAHDAHPMYLTTHFAKKLAAELGVPAIAVQHHHAHAAAVMAEHQVRGPVLALVCDGTGYGLDGRTWGGELLLASLTDFKRLATLRPLELPGGDAAARETWRCGMALLHHAYGGKMGRQAAASRLVTSETQRQMLTHMIRDRVNCAASSGMGRLFDGMAALLGLCLQNKFEAQAAMALEAAAEGAMDVFPTTRLWCEIRAYEPWEIDFGPLTRELISRQSKKFPLTELASFFHEQIARTWHWVIREKARETGIRKVALSGGVFCNERLVKRLTQLLEMEEFQVLRHELTPPNDGGLALGQAAVGAATAAGRGSGRREEPILVGGGV